MDNDKAFLKAIAAAPDDNALRLVYADWLEGRGDPRAEFLRLACDTEVNWPAATVARLEAMEAAIEQKWMAAAMAGRPVLKYHRRTFALLGEKPVLSKTNLRKIERWEARVGMKLPASLREWYSLEGTEQRMDNEIEEFETVPLQQALNAATREVAELPAGAHGNFAIGYWLTGIDSHVVLDGTQDPVVVADELWGGDNFSAFARQRVWARITHTSQDGFRAYGTPPWPELDPEFPALQATEPAFGPRDIDYLNAHFTEAWRRLVAGGTHEIVDPFTGAPLRVFNPPSVLRFFVPGVRLQIVCQGNPQKRATEAYWDISADSPKQLEEVVAEHLWGHRTLAQTLTAPTKSGKRVLAALRRKSVRKE